MSCCREGFDLFNKHGRRAFRRYFPNHVPWGLVWGDTFPQIICWIFGHDEKLATPEGCFPPEYACKRCYKFTTKREKLKSEITAKPLGGIEECIKESSHED